MAAGTVTIAPTTLERSGRRSSSTPTTAPRRTTINSVSVLPGELCGYSGQKLMGILADQPGQGIDYADRIVHVWTDSGDFLIAVHVEAPTGTAGFDAAESVMLADFGDPA